MATRKKSVRVTSLGKCESVDPIAEWLGNQMTDSKEATCGWSSRRNNLHSESYLWLLLLHSISPITMITLKNTFSYCLSNSWIICAILCFSCHRPIGFWLSRAQSLMYCNEHGVLGYFSEEVRGCICPVEHPTCQSVVPCLVGTSSSSCSSCALDNATRCGACHHGNIVHLGSCRPSVAPSLDHYLSLDLDMPDAEVLKISVFQTPLKNSAIASSLICLLFLPILERHITRKPSIDLSQGSKSTPLAIKTHVWFWLMSSKTNKQTNQINK